MMWIFLLSDTFIFTCFLTGYMNVRLSTPVPWPNPSEVFALQVFGVDVPLLLIGIMTFDLITSSGTMALAVNFGYRRDRGRAAALMFITARIRRDFRRHAGVRVDEAHHRGRHPPVGQPDGRVAVRRRVLHDHGLPRPARVGRRRVSHDRRDEGLTRRLRGRETTRSSRSPACIGTSSTWSGCSSSRSSISGRELSMAEHMQRGNSIR